MFSVNVPLNEKNQFLISVRILSIKQDVTSKQYKINIRDMRNTFQGMIDTGANTSAITQEVVDSMGAEAVAIGYKTIKTAGNPVQCPIYRVALFFSDTTFDMEKRKFHVNIDMTMNSTIIEGCMALPKQKQSRGFDCVIGMDILRNYSFQYSHTNKELTF